MNGSVPRFHGDNVRNPVVMIVGVALACCGCSSQPAANSSSASSPSSAAPSGGSSAESATPAVPPEIQQAAEAVFGNEAEVLAHGDLAQNGKEQVLVINRLHKAGIGVVAGTLLTRLTVIENDNGNWKQILLCDEHLKNQNGFLGGAPIQDVGVWRLQFDQDPKKGLQLFLTPYSQKPTSNPITTEVAWDKSVKRYRALDRSFTNFQGENPMLQDTIDRTLH